MRTYLLSYLKKRCGSLLLLCLFTGIFYVTFYLYRIKVEAVSYAFLLFGVFALLSVAIDFVRYVGRCRRIQQVKSSISGGVMDFPKPSDSAEEIYQEIIEDLYRQKSVLESDTGIAKKEMMDYYSLWVHQIKTPISAMRLLLQSEGMEEQKVKKAMKMELFKTEQYVEMVLSYLRMEEMSNDLMLKWYPLDEMIRQAARKYSQMFILQKISLDYRPVESMVLTDEKWLLFVMEQILSNALKYTKSGGTIHIYMAPDKKETLVIEDTGIGIQEEDLPRVFEKGFTGYNGREQKKSTGIGLYLCKQVMEKLNHDITIESAPGEGTKVYLSLYRKAQRLE